MGWFGFKKEWTKREKIAVLKSLCYIIGADRKIEKSEQAVLAGFFSKYGLDAIPAMNEQAAMSQSEMSSIIYKMSSDDKTLILDYWQEAISCDGNIDPQEITVLAVMAEECGINFTRLTFNPRS